MGTSRLEAVDDQVKEKLKKMWMYLLESFIFVNLCSTFILYYVQRNISHFKIILKVLKLFIHSFIYLSILLYNYIFIKH